MHKCGDRKEGEEEHVYILTKFVSGIGFMSGPCVMDM